MFDTGLTSKSKQLTRPNKKDPEPLWFRAFVIVAGQDLNLRPSVYEVYALAVAWPVNERIPLCMQGFACPLDPVVPRRLPGFRYMVGTCRQRLGQPRWLADSSARRS